ncbi:MAG: DUF4173 domain-containing protein [Defluviitaleaceae bacterium]|nr:DUF4173 domain-containing protein [Defluviitaleaceae bacterium]MCL2263499.1 DUF4173 domain-containing protein [Defluviitaleaceae bacterium]MCL2263933.1 DUF4173 domain-containing protein [Defluviitaleaceae bacterium]
MNEQNNAVETWELNTNTAKEYSKAEKILLPVALLIAILFNRILFNNLFLDSKHFNVGANWWGLINAAFWLCYLGLFYAYFWKRVKKDFVLWFVVACVAALGIWNFIFYDRGNVEFGAITFFVIPAVLMAHAQWTAHSFSWKSFDGAVRGMVLAWFEGWFVKPFTGLGEFFGVSASLVSNENRPVLKRAILGFVIVFFMMIFIIPLLMGADQVFGHYVSQIFWRMRFTSIVFHGIVIAIAFGLFYSFLWNIGFGENETATFDDPARIDNVISGIVLGSVIFVYALFCAVQFTYLFARAGLPAGMTFAEYAREGFAQTVIVCAINLLIFGIFLWRGPESSSPYAKFHLGLLVTLLALTGVMLVSGAVRLNLYIDAFGMTWLRLISAWFIIYLAAVIILCIVRIFKKKMPVIGICVMLLLVWYVALGYLNPDGFINWFNVVHRY